MESRALVILLAVLVVTACEEGSDLGADAVLPDAADPAWGEDVRLTDAPGASLTTFNFARDIAVGADDAVHVVWYDDRDGVSQVYYKRSLDGGDSWQADVRLTPDDDTPRDHPAIAVSGGAVHVVWNERSAGGQFQVVVARSLDAGATWQPSFPVSTTGAAAHGSIAADGDTVQVVWGDSASGYTEITHVRSVDGGATWSAPDQISSSLYHSWVGGVAMQGDRVIVSWVDYGDANEEEYVRVSGDGGVTWGAITRMSDDAADSWAPSVAIAGDAVHFFWFDRRHTYSDIEVETTLDETAALVGAPVEPIPPRDPAVYYLPDFEPRLARKRQAIEDAIPGWVASGGDSAEAMALLVRHELEYAAWAMGWEIYYRRSTDGGATFGPETRITNAPHMSARPSVVAVGATVDVVWFDGRDGDGMDPEATEIYHLQSLDGGLTWSTDRRLTDAAGTSQHASIAATADRVHVVWFDARHGDPEVYYKHLVR